MPGSCRAAGALISAVSLASSGFKEDAFSFGFTTTSDVKGVTKEYCEQQHEAVSVDIAIVASRPAVASYAFIPPILLRGQLPEDLFIHLEHRKEFA